MPEPAIPARLEKAVIFLRGEADGRKLLDALPRRIGYYRHAWRLEVGEIAEGSAMSCCVFCTDEVGRACVLKIPTSPAAGRTEFVGLSHWAQSGAVPLTFRHSPSSGAILMERVEPGTTVWPEGESSEVDSLVDLLVSLTAESRRPRSVATDVALAAMRLDWAHARFSDPAVAALRPDLTAARDALAELERAERPHVLVHGDLQAKNILLGSGGRWRAIDPFVAYGDPLMDAALWILDQSGGSPIEDLLERVASVGSFDMARLRKWTFVLATAELRPSNPAVFTRISAFLDDF